MKNKPSSRGLTDLIRKIRRRDSASELTNPEAERSGVELKNILRWEDDGGQMMLARGKNRNDSYSVDSAEHL
jgi:hypothetical protein